MQTLKQPALSRAFPRILVGAVVLAVLGLVAQRLLRDARLLDDQDLHLNLPLGAAASLLLACGVLCYGSGWVVLLRALSPRVPVRVQSLLRGFLYAWMARYVPGKLSYPIGKGYLARLLGYETRAVVLATATEVVLQVLVTTAFGASLMAASLGLMSGNGSFLGLAVAPAVGIVGLHPRVLATLTNRVLRLLGKEQVPPEAFPSLVATSVPAALYLLAAALNGLALYLLLRSLTGAGWEKLPLAMGVFSLSGLVGLLVPLAPAGLGAREGGIAGLMASTITLEAATVLAVVARLWSVIVDAGLAAIALADDYLSGERHLLLALRGRDGVAGRPAAASLADQRAPVRTVEDRAA